MSKVIAWIVFRGQNVRYIFYAGQLWVPDIRVKTHYVLLGCLWLVNGSPRRLDSLDILRHVNNLKILRISRDGFIAG